MIAYIVHTEEKQLYTLPIHSMVNDEDIVSNAAFIHAINKGHQYDVKTIVNNFNSLNYIISTYKNSLINEGK